MTTHLMVDIETLGTRPGAVILSAAFVRFSDEACISLNIDMAEQQNKLGMHTDSNTMAWWQKQYAQDPRAWIAATKDPLPLAQALDYIVSWINWATAPDGDFLIWCHGAPFDCPLLGELFRLAGREAPWAYWQVRDTRTLYDLAGVNVRDYDVPPPHVALNDALAQTRAANEALRRLAP